MILRMDLSFGLEDVPVLFDGSSNEVAFPKFQVTQLSLFWSRQSPAVNVDAVLHR